MMNEKHASQPKGGMNTQGGAELQVVSFCLGNEEFGVNILSVQEINRMISISKVPKAPAYIEGIINLRGRVIPVVNLRRRFELESREFDKQTRIIVLDIAGKILGILVDSVSEVLRIQSASVEPPPPVIGVRNNFIDGVAKLEGKLLILLNIGKLFEEVETELNDAVASAEA